MPNTRSDLAEEKRRQRRRMWREAYCDPENRESVALDNYLFLRVYRAEVLRTGAYVHPRLR